MRQQPWCGERVAYATRQETMCRAEELIDQLSDDERDSLEELGRGPARRKIPFLHAAKLIELGLAELNCGYQELTRQGKRALQVMHRGPAGV